MYPVQLGLEYPFLSPFDDTKSLIQAVERTDGFCRFGASGGEMAKMHGPQHVHVDFLCPRQPCEHQLEALGSFAQANCG